MENNWYSAFLSQRQRILRELLLVPLGRRGFGTRKRWIFVSKSRQDTCLPTFRVTHWLPELFAKNIFWTFWKFSDWIWAKLAQIYSKRHFQHDSMPFFPLASRFTTFLLGHIQRSKFWVFGWESFFNIFFCLPFLSFSYPFSAVINLRLGLLLIQKLPRKHHQDRQFLLWSSHM